MLPAGTSAASWQRIFLALAVGTLGVGCSSAGGSGTSEPTDTSDSAAPVLRTANGQQIFGPGNADPSSDGSAAGPGAGSSPVGSTPSASDEAQKTPVLLAPDAGAGASPPATTRPSPSAAPQPPAAPDDDDDDDEEEEEQEED